MKLIKSFEHYIEYSSCDTLNSFKKFHSLQEILQWFGQFHIFHLFDKHVEVGHFQDTLLHCKTLFAENSPKVNKWFAFVVNAK